MGTLENVARVLLAAVLLSPLIGQDLTVTVVAGPGNAGDGQSASLAFLPRPDGVTVDSNGNLYISDLALSRIRRVSPDGIITTVAGTGARGYTGDGGPASEARLNGPRGLAIDAEGNLFVAETGNHIIRRIAADGTIATVAGIGRCAFSGDGGAALNAALCYPYDVEVAGDGSLYIADTQNNRVRKVESNGTIRSIAGNGEWGDSSDDAPATESPLNGPKALSLSESGELYVCDWSNRIRKITVGGTLTVVAGTGAFGYNGDGRAATSAMIAGPEGITVDRNGNLYISDSWNDRIRRVTPDGVISTVAGKGRFGFSGDGGPAVLADIAYPTMLTSDAEGRLYFCDFGNSRVRVVAPGGQSTPSQVRTIHSKLQMPRRPGYSIQQLSR